MASMLNGGRAWILLFGTIRCSCGTSGSDYPCVLDRVESSNDYAGISDDYGVRGKASGDECIRPYNAITAQYELAVGTYDCRSAADPTTLADANSAPL